MDEIQNFDVISICIVERLNMLLAKIRGPKKESTVAKPKKKDPSSVRIIILCNAYF